MSANISAAFKLGNRRTYPGIEIRPVTKISRLLIIRAWFQLLIIECRLKFTRFEVTHKWIVKFANSKKILPKEDPSWAPKVIDEVNRAIDAASKFYYRRQKD